MQFSPFTPSKTTSHPTVASARWLLQLRWSAVAGQLLTITVARSVLDIELQMGPLLALIGLTTLTNIAFGILLRFTPDDAFEESKPLSGTPALASLMLLDMLVLTFMLYYSGGTRNPFILFYFVNISVAGVILSQFWAWTLAAIAVLGCLFLLRYSIPVVELSTWETSSSRWPIRDQGFFVAFSTCCVVVTYFITVLTDELKRRERLLQEAREQRARTRHLESLATLAAGAGHELATPLSTIAVVSKELSRSLAKLGAPAPITNDVELIRSELDRCRTILSRMKSGTGEAAAEDIRLVSGQELIDEVLSGVRDSSRVIVSLDPNVAQQKVRLPLQAIGLAVRNLVQNAFDASPAGATVQLSLDQHNQDWLLRVTDSGEGMAAEVQQRIGEPFFTTKEPGKGMGLGIYLTSNVIHRLGGKMDIASEMGRGTSIEISLPTQGSAAD